MKKLLFYWKQLKATFWFLPMLIISFSIFLSVGLVSLDNNINISFEGWLRFFLVNSSDSARSILTTISGAMIGVAGTVFSVTLVALTLASSQFGPRLIKNFMYVKLNQIVLGSYVSTYLYCLLVLNAIKDNENYTFIPTISIFVAILATVFNIILLIIFIHQIAISIQADRVVSDISNFIENQVKNLFPDKIGEYMNEDMFIDTAKIISQYKHSTILKSPKSGYLQNIDNQALLKIVEKHDSLIEINYKTGDFFVKDLEIGVIHSHELWEENAINQLIGQFVIGKTKTSQQDIEFSIHQMVEIAARALSTGVNDPYTAISCVDHLTAVMCYLAEAQFPSKYRYDQSKQLRVIAENLDFEGVLDAAFNQIRQFSTGSTAVIIRLMEAQITILKFTKTKSHKKALIKHAEMILTVGKQTIKEKNDLDDLEERAKKILNN
ncbi:DUF2254 domain-containing protein [Paucihalobacter ruber]|uniref:DUF2254 domain-containing protein n=1 Tax=Paucihalobacter ruber TaxID=2567861 RepID=A0A506PJ90_9FLAO|nr:DUF2254 domain-containing protein [Paucihalobacter ruber]TPV32450.1 DUF2254 domain-containing protein [Paucihalobacter ruber]